jgi:hypothetical protein
LGGCGLALPTVQGGLTVSPWPRRTVLVSLHCVQVQVSAPPWGPYWASMNQRCGGHAGADSRPVSEGGVWLPAEESVGVATSAGRRPHHRHGIGRRRRWRAAGRSSPGRGRDVRAWVQREPAYLYRRTCTARRSSGDRTGNRGAVLRLRGGCGGNQGSERAYSHSHALGKTAAHLR